jgi:hypothetical protein
MTPQVTRTSATVGATPSEPRPRDWRLLVGATGGARHGAASRLEERVGGATRESKATPARYWYLLTHIEKDPQVHGYRWAFHLEDIYRVSYLFIRKEKARDD